MKTPSLNVFAQKTSLHMLTCDVILSVFSGVYVVFNPVLKWRVIKLTLTRWDCARLPAGSSWSCPVPDSDPEQTSARNTRRFNINLIHFWDVCIVCGSNTSHCIVLPPWSSTPALPALPALTGSVPSVWRSPLWWRRHSAAARPGSWPAAGSAVWSPCGFGSDPRTPGGFRGRLRSRIDPPLRKRRNYITGTSQAEYLTSRLTPAASRTHHDIKHTIFLNIITPSEELYPDYTINL